MATCFNNGTAVAPSAVARVVTSTGSSNVKSSGGEAIGGVGGSPPGLNERLLLAVTGGGASRGISAPAMPPAAMACLAKKNQPAPVSSVLVSGGSNGSSASSISSSSGSGSSNDSSSGLARGVGPLTGGHPSNSSSSSNGETLVGAPEARVASNGGSQPTQPAVTLQPEPKRLKQPSPSQQTLVFATNGASPAQQAPMSPPPTQPDPVVAPASSVVPAPAARPPVAAKGLSVKPAAGSKAKVVGGDGGQPESGVGKPPSLPTATDTQIPPPSSPNATLPNPTAAGIPPPTPPPVPAPSCRSQAAPQPEAAEPVPHPPPSGRDSTSACVAPPPSSSSSSSSDPAPISTPPVTGADVAAGGRQAASQTGDQLAVPPLPPTATEATPRPPPIDAPAATATAPHTASSPEESTPATGSTATPPATPAAKRPREEECGEESDRAGAGDMEVDSETGSARGAAGCSTDQEGDDTGAADAADAKGIVGSERAGGEDEGTGKSGTGGTEEPPPPPPGRSSKRARVVAGAIPGEEIRPVAAPVQEPFLEVPEVSKADVGKMVISETGQGTLTGVVESFAESEDGLGVWSIRYENRDLREIEDCGELHDDMCGYFEFAGNAAAAEGKQVRTRNSPSLQEEVRSALFRDERSAIGKRVSVIRDKVLHEGQITKYLQPTRDGEFDQWRVTYADGEHEDMDGFELVRPLLRYMERRIEQREVEWGHRTVLVYMHRVGDSSRPFTTLSGISASMPTTIRNEEQDDKDT